MCMRSIHADCPCTVGAFIVMMPITAMIVLFCFASLMADVKEPTCTYNPHRCLTFC
jgi:hypothetical protein